jgi:alkaline phosphatase
MQTGTSPWPALGTVIGACAATGLLLTALLPAQAATPQAWAAHEQEVIAACLAATALQEARAAGETIEFDDRVGMTVLLLAGREAAPHREGRRARELCLFDKTSRKAAVAPADALFTPMRRP